MLGLSMLALGHVQARVDLSGTYDVGTLTPLERPLAYGDNQILTPTKAADLANAAAQRMSRAGAQSDPNRSAPQKGGRVGGYNAFWFDRGDSVALVDGAFRTSIITQPKNGRIPPMTKYGAQRRADFLNRWEIIWRSPDPTTTMNTGTAWWLEQGGRGPYDNMEQRPLAERCIIGSRSTAGPPMLPNIYNNHKRIIQTTEHVMILTEMNHDVRVVRMDDQHRPDSFRTWLGDSVGVWQGDTLVVRTKNFTQTPALSGADEHLEVVERFSLQDDGSLLYQFSVNNPGIWSEVWAGEYVWSVSKGKVYEYACHEGNYALGNIMRGARRLEQEHHISSAGD
ncbi:MAG: hypothetical protein AAF541_06530 [Pseudomonadota bacterium]